MPSSVTDLPSTVSANKLFAMPCAEPLCKKCISQYVRQRDLHLKRTKNLFVKGFWAGDLLISLIAIPPSAMVMILKAIFARACH